MIEANPRASRTVPFVSKAIGLPLAKLACRIMLGERIAELGLPARARGLGFGDHVSVKEAVLPFDRFDGADSLLGPEMRSTGEVMGIARDFPTAFAKAQAAAGAPLPDRGHRVHHGHRHRQGRRVRGSRSMLHDLGFRIVATRGTAEAIERMGVPVRAAEQDRRGLAARRRLDRARRGRPRGQHADRLGRAHRRLGDPPRGGRARDPLHHDAVGRRLRGARDRPRRATASRRRCCACRSCTCNEPPRRGGVSFAAGRRRRGRHRSVAGC